MSQEGINLHRAEDGDEQQSQSGGGSYNSNSAVNDAIGKVLGLLVAVALCVAFSTAIISAVAVVAVAYYYLTRKRMMRPVEVFIYMLATALVGVCLWFILDAPGKFNRAVNAIFMNPQAYFAHHTLLDAIWALSTPLTIAGIIIGSFLGWLWSLKISSDYKKFPEIKFHDTHWMREGNFKYRHTPLQRWQRKRLVNQIEEGANFVLDGEPGRLPGVILGIDEETCQPVYFTTAEIVRHMVKVGAPGSGKTASTENEIRANAKRGITSIVINMKADVDLARKLAKYAHDEGLGFYHFTQANPQTGAYENLYNPRGQAYLDPFANLTLAEKMNIGLAFQQYEVAGEKYKNDVKGTLTVLLNSIQELEKYVQELEAEDAAEHQIFIEDLERAGLVWNNGEFRRFHSALMNPEAVLNALPENNTTGGDLRRRIHDGKSGHVKDSWGTIRGNINTVLGSPFGKWLGLPKNGEPYIDFDYITDPSTTPSIVLFDFNADSEEETSATFGKLLTEMLTTTSSHRRNNNKTSNIVQLFFDEFQTIPLNRISGLLEKARASNVGVSLGQQSLSQLIEKNGEDSVKTLIENVGTIMVLQGMKGGASANIISSIAGTRQELKYTVYSKRELVWWKNFIQWDDIRRYDKTSTVVEVPIIKPSDLINLRGPNPAKGEYYTEAMVIRQTPKYDRIAGAEVESVAGTKIHVLLPKQVLSKLPAVPEEPISVGKPLYLPSIPKYNTLFKQEDEFLEPVNIGEPVSSSTSEQEMNASMETSKSSTPHRKPATTGARANTPKKARRKAPPGVKAPAVAGPPKPDIEPVDTIRTAKPKPKKPLVNPVAGTRKPAVSRQRPQQSEAKSQSNLTPESSKVRPSKSQGRAASQRKQQKPQTPPPPPRLKPRVMRGVVAEGVENRVRRNPQN